MEQSIQKFVTRQKELLSKELKEEEQEENPTEKKNGSLHKMHLTHTSLGLYGRNVLKFTKNSSLLPSHTIKVGDEVEILYQKSNLSGVVSEVSEYSISIALFNKKGSENDEVMNELMDGNGCSIVPRSSVEVHNKMIKSLDELVHHLDHPVVKFMFSKSDISNEIDAPETEEVWYNNTNLDSSQKEAVQFVLHSSYPLTLIHGPPGKFHNHS